MYKFLIGFIFVLFGCHNALCDAEKRVISLMVAYQLDYGIGFEGKLPWRLKGDMQHFRSVTLGKTIIMGRKTYSCIGRPLDRRRNIVISKTMQPLAGVEVYSSLTDALLHIDIKEEVFIIGGTQLFLETIDKADYLYRTVVNCNKPADTFFPKINLHDWIILSSQSFEKDRNNECSYVIQKLKKR